MFLGTASVGMFLEKRPAARSSSEILDNEKVVKIGWWYSVLYRETCGVFALADAVVNGFWYFAIVKADLLERVDYLLPSRRKE